MSAHAEKSSNLTQFSMLYKIIEEVFLLLCGFSVATSLCDVCLLYKLYDVSMQHF